MRFHGTALVTAATFALAGLLAAPAAAAVGSADTLNEQARLITRGQAVFDCYQASRDWDYFKPCGTDQRVPKREVAEVSGEFTIDRPGRFWLEGEAWCDWCYEVAAQWQLQLQKKRVGPVEGDAWEAVFTGGGWGYRRCIGESCNQYRISETRLPRLEPGTYRLYMHQATTTPDNPIMTYNTSRYDIQVYFLPDEPYEAPIDPLGDELADAEADRDRCMAALAEGRRHVARLEENLGTLENSSLVGQSTMGSANILADQALQQQLHRVGANDRYVLDALDPQRPIDRLADRIARERQALAEQEARCRALDHEVNEIQRQREDVPRAVGSAERAGERRPSR